MNRAGAALLGSFGLLCLTLAAANPPESGLLAQSCSSCHARDSASALNLDRLDAAEIEAQLIAFKAGTRRGTVMNRIARGYTKEQIALLARHFGRKP